MPTGACICGRSPIVATAVRGCASPSSTPASTRRTLRSRASPSPRSTTLCSTTTSCATSPHRRRRRPVPRDSRLVAVCRRRPWPAARHRAGRNVSARQDRRRQNETRVEEDNYVAALQWADSIGVDIVSSSLAYLIFDNGFSYTPSQLNGDVAVTTVAVDAAARRGITVVTAAGNEGPGFRTVWTPGDADSALTIAPRTRSATSPSSRAAGPPPTAGSSPTSPRPV